MYDYIKNFAEKNGLEQTLRALDFAVEKHEGQFRNGPAGEVLPYISHPMSMVRHAIALGIGQDEMLAALLLHDVCEDCGVAPEELPVEEAAREVVRLVTKTGAEKTQEGMEAYFRRISQNPAAALVKILDRCHNLSSMAFSFNKEKMLRYIGETRHYLMPMLTDLRNQYPELAEAGYLLEYHIRSVQDTVEVLAGGDYVWYACYGSNINEERFMRYINGCSDTTPPVEAQDYLFAHDIYFAASSARWEDKAVAFLDDTQPGRAFGRIYKITRAQYEEIMQQEGSKYTKLLEFEPVDGLPVFSFTSPEKRSDVDKPSQGYFDTILEGLVDVYGEERRSHMEQYLRNAAGL